MSSLEVKARLRREQDILDRIDNVKRLIQMKTTLRTAEDASNYMGYKWYSRSDGKAFGAELINDLSEVIQLQLLSIVALCNGDNPDIGGPCPMLEWQPMNKKSKKHPVDRFYDVWEECLRWNT